MNWKEILPEGGEILSERDLNHWKDLGQNIYQDNLLLVCGDQLVCWNMSNLLS